MFKIYGSILDDLRILAAPENAIGMIAGPNFTNPVSAAKNIAALFV